MPTCHFRKWNLSGLRKRDALAACLVPRSNSNWQQKIFDEVQESGWCYEAVHEDPLLCKLPRCYVMGCGEGARTRRMRVGRTATPRRMVEEKKVDTVSVRSAPALQDYYTTLGWKTMSRQCCFKMQGTVVIAEADSGLMPLQMERFLWRWEFIPREIGTEPIRLTYLLVFCCTKYSLSRLASQVHTR